jgi:pimeloyl-ACP methyl ester carboxylesterase
MRVVQGASPELAALIGESLMFRTSRRALARQDRAVLERGTAFRVRSPAGKLAAWTWGQGPVVVLVHGWNGNAVQLTPMVAPLVKAGYRVVAFDAPGHGESPGNRSSLLEFADAIDAVVDTVRPLFGMVHALVAHSMGGAAATYSMSRWARKPEDKLEGVLRDAALPCQRFVFVAPPIDVRDFVRSFSKRVGLGPDTVAAMQHRIETRFDVRLEDLYAPVLARDLSAPLLVIHDEDDREVPLERGRTLAQAWPGGQLLVTRGLGHNRILSNPEVLRHIVAFVQDS